MKAEQTENQTNSFPPSDDTYELLYKEAIKLYEELKTNKKKSISNPQISKNVKNVNEANEPNEYESLEKTNDQDLVNKEMDEKGVKININLNGEGIYNKFLYFYRIVR